MSKPYEELTQDEYRERYVPKFPEGKDWPDMTKDERSTFIQRSVELGYKKEYDIARTMRNSWETTPEWEELTHEQQENIRAEVQRHAQEMHEFGQSLSKMSNDRN